MAGVFSSHPSAGDYVRLKELIGRQSVADASELLSCKSFDEIAFDMSGSDYRFMRTLPYATQNCLLVRAAAETLDSVLDDLHEHPLSETRGLYPMVVVTDWQQLDNGQVRDVDGYNGLLVTALWCGNFRNPILGSFRLDLPEQPSDQLNFVAECLGNAKDKYLLYEGVNNRYGQPFIERVYIRSRKTPAPWGSDPEPG